MEVAANEVATTPIPVVFLRAESTIIFVALRK
jgi:hypothetical protein